MFGFGRKLDLGAAGERAAAKFLRGAGYRIIDKNFRTAIGEIDVIALDGETIVFVEVKTLRSDEAADPEAKVDVRKREKLERVAGDWLARKRYPDRSYRFDAVSVVMPVDGEPRIRHIIEAFVPRS